MELEVSQKVRAAIKAKLLEIGCHVDEELPDYIMVLIANRRSMVQMENDLILFLADNSKKFVGWLSHVLKKLEQVTATSEVDKPMPSVVAPVSKEDKKGKRKSKKDAQKEKSKDKNKKADLKKEEKKKTRKLDRSSSRVDKLEKSLELIPGSHSFKGAVSVSSVEVATFKTGDAENLQKRLLAAASGGNQPKVSMTLKKMDTSTTKTLSSAFFETDEPSTKKQLRVLSDDEEMQVDGKEPEVHKKPVERTRGKSVIASSDKMPGSSLNLETPPAEPVTLSDELILNTDENEFADNLDELRRIALESQAQKRQDKNEPSPPAPAADPPPPPPTPTPTPTPTPRKRIFRDVMINYLAQNEARKTQRPKAKYRRSFSKSVSPQDIKRRRESPTRVRRDPMKSVFDRLTGREQLRRKRSVSRSPPRRLSSKIGNVIHRSEEYDPVRPSVSSVIKVTDRPKRNLKANNKLLLLAVADAQKSIIQKGQLSEKEVNGNKSKNTAEEKFQVISNRRFAQFPEADTDEIYEPHLASVRRKSVKERLGVKTEIRKPMRERLGISNNPHASDSMDSFDDQIDFYNQNEFNIVINVNDTGFHNTEHRNVTLASSDISVAKLNRISIQVNNSEEDDTSEDEDSSDSVEEDNKKTEIPGIAEKTHKSNNTKVNEYESDVEVTVSVNDEDKLPEVPESDNEYIVEEIEIDESPSNDQSQAGSPPAEKCKPTEAVVSSSDEIEKALLKSEESKLLMSVLAPTISYPAVLPDLRGKLTKPFAKVLPISGPLKCKFWPKCQYKNNCIFDHPKCKFNPCTNQQCVYKHEMATKTEDNNSSLKKVCKYFPKCTSMLCNFFHPSPCRFALGCTDAKCQNYHPGVTIGVQKLKAKGLTVIPQVNELKWVKKE